MPGILATKLLKRGLRNLSAVHARAPVQPIDDFPAPGDAQCAA
eukprot:COSAG01_NODE_54240_length_333_cov_1.102564_1_plen_42_part_10